MGKLFVLILKYYLLVYFTKFLRNVPLYQIFIASLKVRFRLKIFLESSNIKVRLSSCAIVCVCVRVCVSVHVYVQYIVICMR